MFHVLLFSCELKLKLKQTKTMHSQLMIYSVNFSLKKRKETTVCVIQNTRGVLLLYPLEVSKYETLDVFLLVDIRDVKYCYMLEARPFINTTGVNISRAY